MSLRLLKQTSIGATAKAYETANQPLTDVLESASSDSWANASPCERGSARNVLWHMIATQREFFSGRGIDLGDAPDVDNNPAGAWRDHAKLVLETISDDVVASTGYDGHLGPTTMIGATLEQFYVWDMIVHRWDIARAIAADARLSEAHRGSEGRTRPA